MDGGDRKKARRQIHKAVVDFFFFFFLNQHDRIALLVSVCVNLFILDMLTVSQRAKFATCGDKSDMMR